MWNINKPWHATIMLLLCRQTPVVNWEILQGDVLAFATFLTFERYKRNSNYEDFKINWLLLSVFDVLKRENDRLNLTSKM